ncbi:hypothetical protein [Spirosoma pollinicola]|uniref:N-acetyltransferase domain-containing protein n=1 Tax=Spirosoma pollinicola TaxID=2057025 RepID=A0A2K8ZAV8_9BACT|nr:hypothetical protein [Spirosoma pollinicola]AUD07016.1 hypothetical protein CWM47_37465 [Spirosoma pollinicola]
MNDYLVEVWDWYKQNWYLIKAFRQDAITTDYQRLGLAKALVDSLAKQHPVLKFRLNQILN